MPDVHARTPWPGGAAGEHISLSYAYLNADDYDTLASLLDADATVLLPGQPSVSGREAVIEAERRRRYRYQLREVWSVDRRHCVALGVLFPPGVAAEGVDFADVFTLSPHGLIASRRTYVGGMRRDSVGGARQDAAAGPWREPVADGPWESVTGGCQEAVASGSREPVAGGCQDLVGGTRHAPATGAAYAPVTGATHAPPPA
ncbi:nuclear transport factor 2 family protein [Streptomyces sp. NPDC057638]|uniref:nuclear transport factor 2 family protein n=1 Tax=Streptomyces sp. NPDC057638 TaxID=3346190 RepID=UPI00369F2440